jgi:hypothetical protein
VSRKKKVLIICHLCFAFSYLMWLLIQPAVKEIVSQKSQSALYNLVMEREALVRLLPEEDQFLLAESGELLQNKVSPSLLHDMGRLLFVDTPPFALAWLFFSLAICLLLLLRIEGAAFCAWLLPLLVVGYAYFLCMTPQRSKESLFPSEEYVLNAITPSEKEALGRRESLLLGWHRYLVREWAHEIPASEEPLFQEQLDRGLFAFNVARLKWILEGKGDEIVLAGFTTPPSLPRLGCYFIWNLLFAWLVNRKEKHSSFVAQSLPIC